VVLLGVTCRAHLNLSKPWYTQITANGKNHYLGYFPTEIEAAKAFDRAARRFEGTNAVLNFPDDISDNDGDIKMDVDQPLSSLKSGPSGTNRAATPATDGEIVRGE